MTQEQELQIHTHKDVVEVAYKWLLKRVGFAFKELRSYSNECPDVIGFRFSESIMIECKVSRSDFLADKKKGFRKDECKGMGNYRLFCCPSGLISKEELPPKWGLIYVNVDRKAMLVVNPFNSKGGNMFMPENRFNANQEEERKMFYTALRRLQIRGRIDEIYQDPKLPETEYIVKE